ncbi:MAG: hypothetical protein R2688_05535 [Fimbriimonadaceae bacterium]
MKKAKRKWFGDPKQTLARWTLFGLKKLFVNQTIEGKSTLSVVTLGGVDAQAVKLLEATNGRRCVLQESWQLGDGNRSESPTLRFDGGQYGLSVWHETTRILWRMLHVRSLIR